MRDMLSSVGDAATAIGSRIRSILHFSTPDEGPLRDYESWMPDFMSGLAVGIRSNRGLVRREAAGAADDIAAALYSSVDPSAAFPRGYAYPSSTQRSSGNEGPTYILGAFDAALERAINANSASNRPITTIFKVGEKEWARATYDPLNAVKREKGFSLISNFN